MEPYINTTFFCCTPLTVGVNISNNSCDDGNLQLSYLHIVPGGDVSELDGHELGELIVLKDKICR